MVEDPHHVRGEIGLRLLGPVELRFAGQVVDLGPPRQRNVVAALAVDVGQRLIRLPGGYLLDLDPDRVDLHRFRRLVDRGRDAGLADAEQLALLRQALGLWRGMPLANLSGEWVERMREGLQEQRLDLVTGWSAIETRLGNAASIIGPLTELAAEFPLAESLVAALMRALHAAGRGGTRWTAIPVCGQLIACLCVVEQKAPDGQVELAQGRHGGHVVFVELDGVLDVLGGGACLGQHVGRHIDADHAAGTGIRRHPRVVPGPTRQVQHLPAGDVTVPRAGSHLALGI